MNFCPKNLTQKSHPVCGTCREVSPPPIVSPPRREVRGVDDQRKQETFIACDLFVKGVDFCG